MKLSRRLLIVLLLLVIAVRTEASITKHEYQIPGLIGVHSQIDKTFNAPFDLKTTFAEIGNVELYLEGNASPGSAVANEGGRKTFELPVNLDIDAGRESSPDSIARPDISRKATGAIKQMQPEKSNEIMKIAKADSVPTVTTEASDNSRTITGDQKPKETNDDLQDYEPQPQYPDQMFTCDNNVVASIDGSVCGREYYQVHCVREPCPRQSRWHSYPNVETACSYKGIQVYVREFARGECIMKKIDRNNHDKDFLGSRP